MNKGEHIGSPLQNEHPVCLRHPPLLNTVSVYGEPCRSSDQFFIDGDFTYPFPTSHLSIYTVTGVNYHNLLYWIKVLVFEFFDIQIGHTGTFIIIPALLTEEGFIFIPLL
jgi:hypothetical protein